MKYIIIKEDENRTLLSNCDRECLNCFSELDSKKVQSSYKLCDKTKMNIRYGIRKKNDLVIFLCINGDEAKSTRYFKFISDNIVDVFGEFNNSLLKQTDGWTKKFNTLIHNITTLNKKASDSLYLMLDEDGLRKSDDKVQYVMSKLNVSKQMASSLLKFRKSIHLMNNEIVVERILREGLSEKKPANHVLYKLLQMAFSYFWDDFMEKGIRINFGSNHSEIYVDFDSIMPALIHMVSNDAKYAQPSSNIEILYEEQTNYIIVHIEMDSLCIYADEETAIYDDVYSGREAKKLGEAGTGIGLYAVRRLFELNDSTFNLIRGDRTWSFNGICYSNNVAKLCFPKENLYIRKK